MLQWHIRERKDNILYIALINAMMKLAFVQFPFTERAHVGWKALNGRARCISLRSRFSEKIVGKFGQSRYRLRK